MKKIIAFIISGLLATTLFAQETPAPEKKKEKTTLSSRSNDHLVLQLGYAGWNGTPDTVNLKGLSKTINAYFMLDFPFKTSPKMSVAIGAGIGSDHIRFTETNLGIKDKTTSIRFNNVPDTNHFKKTKLATVYLEAPVELRFSANPETGNGIKAALGVKIGTLLNAHTRNTKFQDKNGNSLNDYTMKESSKYFFNKTRVCGTVRIGYGNFSLFGSYQFTPLFKDGAGPLVRPFSMGLSLGGL